MMPHLKPVGHQSGYLSEPNRHSARRLRKNRFQPTPDLGKWAECGSLHAFFFGGIVSAASWSNVLLTAVMQAGFTAVSNLVPKPRHPLTLHFVHFHRKSFLSYTMSCDRGCSRVHFSMPAMLFSLSLLAAAGLPSHLDLGKLLLRSFQYHIFSHTVHTIVPSLGSPGIFPSCPFHCKVCPPLFNFCNSSSALSV